MACLDLVLAGTPLLVLLTAPVLAVWCGTKPRATTPSRSERAKYAPGNGKAAAANAPNRTASKTDNSEAKTDPDKKSATAPTHPVKDATPDRVKSLRALAAHHHQQQHQDQHPHRSSGHSNPACSAQNSQPPHEADRERMRTHSKHAKPKQMDSLAPTPATSQGSMQKGVQNKSDKANTQSPCPATVTTRVYTVRDLEGTDDELQPTAYLDSVDNTQRSNSRLVNDEDDTNDIAEDPMRPDKNLSE